MKLCLFSAFLFLFFSGLATAKRIPPKEVSPIVANGVRYSAEGDGRDSYLVATSEASGKPLWRVKVFHTRIKFWLEEDNQWVFISDMKLAGASVLVRNEKDRCYSISLKTKRVKKIDCDSNFLSQEPRALEGGLDSISIKVLTICKLFQDLSAYKGKRIAVRGEFVNTMEGAWIAGRCKGNFVTDGYRWPVALSFIGQAHCSPVSPQFCDPAKWPENPDYVIDGYSDGATTATFIGVLIMKDDYDVVCVNGRYEGNGFGHLNGAVAELAVDRILNAVATPTRIRNRNDEVNSQRCIPGENSPK